MPDRPRPRDVNSSSQWIVREATAARKHIHDRPADVGEDPAAVALGRTGRDARAANLTPEQRTPRPDRMSAQHERLH